uniref:glucuronosyltransferase n=1 Tax=Haemonchus placei TaxID=6290 RepID=A0A158QPL1_HAEPC
LENFLASVGVTGDSSDFFARLLNLLFVYSSWKFQSSFASAAEQAMMEKLGPTATPIWDTVSNMSWILLNTEPLLDFDRPTLHKIVPIGGLGEWNRTLNIRQRNVLVSFGSVATTSKMPKEMKQTVLNAIKSHPDITFIWKYDQLDDPAAAGVDNLILSKWTPQTDLLGISATFGKPLVAIPLFADQMRNAQLAEKFGFGEYRMAALRMKNLLKHRPFTPQEKLVKTVEIAAQFGDMPELKVSGRKLGFVVYYNLDLLAMLFAIFALMTVVPLYLLYRCTRRRSFDTKLKPQ